ncbi:MAG: response regulator transcription factor [bacterium]
MIKILIADDHAVVRKGLKQILAETPDMSVTEEAKNGNDVIAKVNQKEYDVIVLDISMPGKSGLEVLKELKSIKPKLPILVLSMHPEEQYAIRVLKAGAAGYITKESAPDELVAAIRKVSSGGRYITSSLAEKLAFDLVSDSSTSPHKKLSNREYTVMCMIATGKTVNEIAKELYLSVKTISTYRSRILDKMRIKTTAQLIRYAIKNKLVE